MKTVKKIVLWIILLPFLLVAWTFLMINLTTIMIAKM